MIRRSFRIGLRVGLLLGIVAAVVKTVQSRRVSTGIGDLPAPADSWTRPTAEPAKLRLPDPKRTPEPAPEATAPRVVPDPVDAPEIELESDVKPEAEPEAEPEPTRLPPEAKSPTPVTAKPETAPAPAAKRERPLRAAKKATPRQPWVDPNGNICPPTHPVKAKLASKIFHMPGMLNYDRTAPDRCYVDAANAEADGLRAAKR